MQSNLAGCKRLTGPLGHQWVRALLWWQDFKLENSLIPWSIFSSDSNFKRPTIFIKNHLRYHLNGFFWLGQCKSSYLQTFSSYQLPSSGFNYIWLVPSLMERNGCCRLVSWLKEPRSLVLVRRIHSSEAFLQDRWIFSIIHLRYYFLILPPPNSSKKLWDWFEDQGINCPSPKVRSLLLTPSQILRTTLTQCK